MTVHLINIKFEREWFHNTIYLGTTAHRFRHLSNTLIFAEAHLANNALSGIPQFEIHCCYIIPLKA